MPSLKSQGIRVKGKVHQTLAILHRTGALMSCGERMVFCMDQRVNFWLFWKAPIFSTNSYQPSQRWYSWHTVNFTWNLKTMPSKSPTSSSLPFRRVVGYSKYCHKSGQPVGLQDFITRNRPITLLDTNSCYCSILISMLKKILKTQKNPGPAFVFMTRLRRLQNCPR